MYRGHDLWLATLSFGRREMRPITSIERNDFCHTRAANIFTTQFWSAGESREVFQSRFAGVSIVQTGGSRISQWSHYYDGPTSRRYVLASYFTEWIEL